jgi:DNA repair and recombination protein RAD52
MTFTPEQIESLNAPLSRSAVKGRKQGGREVHYVEGWHVIAEANRIFGFDGWASETIDARCVSEKDRLIGEAQRPGFGVTYVAKVRITTIGNVFRDGVGAGHGIDTDLGQAHESAIKEAETDARKRAFMTFGNPFGLALYDKQQSNVVDETEIIYRRYLQDTIDVIEAFGPDHDARLRWWNADEQKKARRDFNLSPGDLITLKNLITSKAPKKVAP